MAGRLEMPNGRAGHGSRQRFLEEHPGGQDAGLVEKSRDSRRAQYAAGGGLVALGAPRMRSVGPAIAAGREYAREAGDSASFRRLDRAAGLRRQFLTGTTASPGAGTRKSTTPSGVSALPMSASA
jgi:hypothetical protein